MLPVSFRSNRIGHHAAQYKKEQDEFPFSYCHWIAFHHQEEQYTYHHICMLRIDGMHWSCRRRHLPCFCWLLIRSINYHTRIHTSTISADVYRQLLFWFYPHKHYVVTQKNRLSACQTASTTGGNSKQRLCSFLASLCVGCPTKRDTQC